MFNELYKNEKHPWGKSARPIITQNKDVFKKDTVLDLGCGDGKDILYLASEGFNVIGVDFSDEGLKTLTKDMADANLSDKVTAINMNVSDFVNENPRKKYSNIISFMTLHFLIPDKTKAILDWMKDNTENGGINIIQDFTNEGEFDLENKTGFYLRKNQLLEIYKDWEIIDYSERLSKTKAGPRQTVAAIVAKKV